MACYMVAQVKVDNPTIYQEYVKKFGPILVKYDGELAALSDAPLVLEGNWTGPRTVILKFPNSEKARKWFQSADYQEIAAIRRTGAKANIILLET